jgi:hypothetical protein
MPDTEIKHYHCRHIFTDGHRCGSNSLRNEDFCFYHHNTRRPKPAPDLYPNPLHLRNAPARGPFRHPGRHRPHPPAHRQRLPRLQTRRPPTLRPPDRLAQPPQGPRKTRGASRRDHPRRPQPGPRPNPRDPPVSTRENSRRIRHGTVVQGRTRTLSVMYRAPRAPVSHHQWLRALCPSHRARVSRDKWVHLRTHPSALRPRPSHPPRSRRRASSRSAAPHGRSRSNPPARSAPSTAAPTDPAPHRTATADP